MYYRPGECTFGLLGVDLTICIQSDKSHCEFSLEASRIRRPHRKVWDSPHTKAVTMYHPNCRHVRRDLELLRHIHAGCSRSHAKASDGAKKYWMILLLTWAAYIWKGQSLARRLHSDCRHYRAGALTQFHRGFFSGSLGAAG